MKTNITYLLLGLLLASSALLPAQTTEPLALARAGVRENGAAISGSTVLSNGTTVIVGDKSMSNSHSKYGFVTFTRSDGSLIKEVLIGEGNPGASEIEGIIAEPGTDNVYVVGHTIIQTGRFKSREKFNNDGLVVKFDRQGNVLWHQVFGGRNTDRYKQICFSQEGNITVFGTEGTSIMHHQNIMRTLSPNGQMLSRKVLAFSEDEYIMEAVTAQQGGYWLAVRAISRNPSNNYIILTPSLCRLNSMGNQIARTPLKGNKNQQINDLLETADGQVLLAIKSYSSDGDFIGTGHYLFSFDQQAQMQWRQHFLVEAKEIHTMKITTNTLGEIYCAINVSDVVPEFPLKVVGMVNIWLAKLDINGGLISKKRVNALGHFCECTGLDWHQGSLRMSIDGQAKHNMVTYIPHDAWYCSVADF